MPRKISPEQLIPLIGTADCPIVVDVRREQAFRSSPTRIAGAIWRDHMAAADWARDLPAGRPVVVYCVHGHNVSALAASLLAADGIDVSVLEGGIEAFAAAGGPLVAREAPGVDVTPRQAERVGDARAAQDRSHRLSVADPPLHRSARGLPFRAGRLGQGRRRGAGRDPVRHRGRALFASRRDLHASTR